MVDVILFARPTFQ